MYGMINKAIRTLVTREAGEESPYYNYGGR